MNEPRRPSRRYDYETDGQRIYRASFAMIRDEARVQLAAMPDDLADVGVRMMHAAGDVTVVDHIQAHPNAVHVARQALHNGARILTDSEMLARGITRRRLPADNEVVCTLRDEAAMPLAREWGTTRSAAAVSLWGDRLDGAVVAIGNAPTALFHLLEMLLADENMPENPRPAVIVGMPVGFIGSAESKVALTEHRLPEGGQVPWIVVHGRRGGSAMAASAVNALAHESELA